MNANKTVQMAIILTAVLCAPIAHAQNKSQTVVSVPIVFVGAKPLKAPAKLLAGLVSDGKQLFEEGEVDVVDVSFSVVAKSLDQLAPSLQPRLFIGGDYYEVFRVEYENWDAANSKPIDDAKPVGEMHFYHFVVPLDRAESIEGDQPAFLTTLTKSEILQKMGEKLTFDSLKTLDNDLSEHAIKLNTQQLLK